MPEDQPQEVQEQVIAKGKTTFGLPSLSKPTPMWVTWIFRTEFVLNKVLLFVLGASTIFTANQVKESLVWIAAVDMAVWSLGRFVGINKAQLESDAVQK